MEFELEQQLHRTQGAWLTQDQTDTSKAALVFQFKLTPPYPTHAYFLVCNGMQWRGWIDEWLDGWAHACMAGWLVGWLAAWMVGWLNGWVVGWLDGWMDGWKCMCVCNVVESYHFIKGSWEAIFRVTDK